MLLHSAVSGAKRISLRLILALLVPVGIIVCLVYIATVEEANTHARNMRWLAQTATQIHDQVQNHSNLVRDRARAHDHAANAKEAPYSHETLKLPGDRSACNDRWEHLAVVDDGHERQLRFSHKSGKHFECAQADLSKIVESALRKDVFTSVVLAQRSGRVLYQSGPESLRLTDVSFLFSSSASGRSNWLAAKSGSPAKDAPIRTDVPTASMHMTSLIGDSQYSVFVQPLPIRLHAGTGAKDTDWILIGLLEKTTSLPSSSPNDMMLVLPFAILLALLSWPLQRLWSMSPFEALRQRDVVVIIVCSLGVAITLSLLGVSEYSRRSSIARADAQIRRFADALGSHFRDEIQLALRQLRRMDEIASKGKPTSQTHILKHLEQNDIYLPFEYADWIDDKGDKTIRWTPKATAPQLVNVLDRSYFQDVLSGDTVVLRDHARGQRGALVSEPFAIEQVLSRTSGHAVTMLGLPSHVPGQKVVSLAVNLFSLTDPVAPRDLGFAIIDLTGKVLFHSEPSRMFVENLFDECQQSMDLRGIVMRRLQAYMDLNYLASPHRMFVTPIPGAEELPWTLIVFRKLSANRIGRMQVLVDTSVLLFVYAAGLALLIGLLLAVRAGRARQLALPRWWTGVQLGYPYVATAGLLLLIAAWRAFGRLHGSALLYVSIASAFAFVLISTLGLRYSGGGRRRRIRLAGVPVVLAVLCLCLQDWVLAVTAPLAALMSGLLFCRIFATTPRDKYSLVLRTAWLAWGIQLVLALCVMPALVLSRLSHEYEIGLRIRDSQWWLWQNDTQRRQALTRAVDQTPGSPEVRKRLLQAVLRDNTTAAPLYYYGTTIPGDAEQQCCTVGKTGNVFQAQLADAFPMMLLAAIELPNEDRLIGFDARRRALEPAGGLWTWVEHERDLCLYSDARAVAWTELPVFNPFRGRDDVVQANSEQQSNFRSTGQRLSALPAWAALIALVCAAAFWMHMLRRQLLLVSVSRGKSGMDTHNGNAPVPNRLFLLARPGPRQGLPENLSSLRRVDLARADLQLNLQAPQSLPDAGLLLDHFEARFTDAKVRIARLELLEMMVAQERPVTVISTIDCVRYLAGGASGDPDSAVDDSELNRWGAVMNHFERRTLLPETGGRASYAAIWDACSQQEKALLTQMSRHDFVNPRAGHLVSGLLERGVIRRTQDLRLHHFNADFRNFVAAAGTYVRQKSGRQTAGRRLPVYAIGLVLLGFVLFVSQEEVTMRLIGFLTTVTGGFEAIRKQLAGMQGDSGEMKKS